MEEIDFDKKKKLADKIKKINNSEYLHKIYQIIVKYNPSLSPICCTNGVMFMFHNLKNETYYKLSAYLKQITDIQNEEQFLLSQDASSSCKDNVNSKFKYTNKEKSIMNRKDYEAKILSFNEIFNKVA